MKKVLCGDGKGYLIPKKEFDAKIRERFKEELKGQYIDAVANFFSLGGVSISFFNENLIKRKDGCVILPAVNEKKVLVVERSVVKELFSIKEEIDYCELKEEFEKGKFAQPVRSEFIIGPEDNLYYFLYEKQRIYWEVMAEIKE